MLPMYSASTLWKQTLRQLVSVAFCWDQNFTLSPITTRVGLGLCRLELRLQRNSVVFVFWWNILCGCTHKSIVQLCSFLTSWAASIFRVSQRIKMCAGRFSSTWLPWFFFVELLLEICSLAGGKGEMRGGHWGDGTCKKTSSQLRMERSSISRQTRASFLCRGQPDNDAAQWKRWKQHCWKKVQNYQIRIRGKYTWIHNLAIQLYLLLKCAYLKASM